MDYSKEGLKSDIKVFFTGFMPWAIWFVSFMYWDVPFTVSTLLCLSLFYGFRTNTKWPKPDYEAVEYLGQRVAVISSVMFVLGMALLMVEAEQRDYRKHRYQDLASICERGNEEVCQHLEDYYTPSSSSDSGGSWVFDGY